MSKIDSSDKKTLITALLAAIIILLSLYPFWFFQEYSAMGWYDEVNAQIPANFISKNLTDGQTFIHEYASGVGTNLTYGGEKYSFYKLLISKVPLWVANITLKFFSLFTFFIGFFCLLRVTFNTSRLFSFAGALFALFTSYLPYGWTLNGHGCDLSVAIFAALAVFGKFKSFKINITIGIITSLMAPLVSSPIFLFPFVFFLLLFMLVGLNGKKIVDKSRIKLLFVMALIVIPLYTYNWSYLYYVIIDSRDFSARILGVLPTRLDHENLIGSIKYYLKYNFFSFIDNHRIFSTSSLLGAYIAIILLAIIKRNIRVVVAMAIIGFIFPVNLELLLKAYEIPIIQSYRWSIVLLLLPIMSVISISHLLTMNYLVRAFTAPVSIVFMILAFRGIYILTDYTMDALHYKGGVAVTDIYNDLKNLGRGGDRVITDHSNIDWPTALYYGLHTFDGTQTSFSHRRHYFLAYGVSDPPKENYHTSNHFFYFSPDVSAYNTAMLEMANVRYILSSKSKIKQSSSPILRVNGIRYSDLDSGNPLKPFFIDLYGEISLANDLFVFELENPWARMFPAGKITFSEHAFDETNFYRELVSVSRHEVLIARDDYYSGLRSTASTNNLNIGDFTLTGTGARVDIIGGSGLLVFNQIYVPYWSASCDGEDVYIFPVNGIMMGAYTPVGCSELVFTYGNKRGGL